eukprot:EG_transcript_15542
MTNGKQPALPPHALYDQPPLFAAPTSAKALQEYVANVPPEWNFPFRDPLPAALMELEPTPPRNAEDAERRKGRRARAPRNARVAAGGRASKWRSTPAASPSDADPAMEAGPTV